ncbi:MAG: hypothetical protein IPH57_17375 [Saprospiraceae bacterium]|nr:hypothetical protein [Saprospiraceae bacterium]
MKKLSWIFTIIGAILGIVILFATLFDSTGAPQQAAGAAIAVAFAVIPYCIARAISELQSVKDTNQ